VRNINRKEISS